MKRLCLSMVFVWLLASFAFAQGAQVPPNPSPSNAQAPASGSDADIRGAFPTTLVKSIDTKKLKEGDPIICQTSGALRSSNGMMIPSGAKVIGHVVKVESKSKGAATTSLTMEFDKIEVTKDKEFSMQGILQAVGPNLGGGNGPDTGGMSGSGQMMAGHGGESTMPPPTPGAVTGPNSGVHPLNAGNSRPIVIADSQGVLGIRNLQMEKDSTLTSTDKDIKLDTGTQMLIHAVISVPTK